MIPLLICWLCIREDCFDRFGMILQQVPVCLYNGLGWPWIVLIGIVIYECTIGFYTGQPEYLRRKMTEIAGRIRSLMDVDETIRVCPEAYENVDTSNLISPPGKKIVGIGLLTLCLIVLVLAVQITLFIQSRSDLSTSLESIIGEDAAAVDSSE